MLSNQIIDKLIDFVDNDALVENRVWIVTFIMSIIFLTESKREEKIDKEIDVICDKIVETELKIRVIKPELTYLELLDEDDERIVELMIKDELNRCKLIDLNSIKNIVEGRWEQNLFELLEEPQTYW